MYVVIDLPDYVNSYCRECRRMHNSDLSLKLIWSIRTTALLYLRISCDQKHNTLEFKGQLHKHAHMYDRECASRDKHAAPEIDTAWRLKLQPPTTLKCRSALQCSRGDIGFQFDRSFFRGQLTENSFLSRRRGIRTLSKINPSRLLLCVCHYTSLSLGNMCARTRSPIVSQSSRLSTVIDKTCFSIQWVYFKTCGW